MITTPWTDDQVMKLNIHQRATIGHPYTCETHSDTPLVAKNDGWHCPECDYTQNWAWQTSIIFMGMPANITTNPAGAGSEASDE